MMLYNMGAWVFMSFIHILLLPSSLQESMGKVLDGDSVISAEKEIDLTDTIHGAVPDSHLKMSTADHQPYDVLVYNLDYSDALNAYSEVKHRPRDTKAYQNTYSVSEDSILEHGEFSSVENDEKGNLNQGTEYLETSGFEPLSSVTSINLEDPKQIETIRTQSYHRETNLVWRKDKLELVHLEGKQEISLTKVFEAQEYARAK
ncbi:hypothetical protein JTB14_024838 [Gonioctena quinquepunctata]|nr:hypothetical protein JTB14_024838 [Gonioctena quinquepunctata]